MRGGRDDLVVNRWGARFLGRRFPCAIGRGGVSLNKREGDGATPVGALRLVGLSYRADRLAHPSPARPVAFRMSKIGPAHLWSDDPKDSDYNQLVVSRDYPYSHERLRRADRMYDLFVVTDWNRPNAEKGLGSAIFVHCWKSPRRPTAGCVAFMRSDLLWIIQRWKPRSRLIVQP